MWRVSQHLDKGNNSQLSSCSMWWYFRSRDEERQIMIDREKNRSSYYTVLSIRRIERGRASAWDFWCYQSWGKSSFSLFIILISPSLPHHASPLHFIRSDGNTRLPALVAPSSFSQAPPHRHLYYPFICWHCFFEMGSTNICSLHLFHGTLTARFLT